jgi:hypothetical protein
MNMKGGKKMASDFRPDYNSKDPYANAPDEYYKMVLAQYVPTAEHPLPPIPPQHIPANYASKHPVK